MGTKTKKEKAKSETSNEENPAPETNAPETSLTEDLKEAETDAKGNAYLPGTAPVVIAPIINAVKDIETSLKPAFGRARDALKQRQQELADLCHDNIQHFSKADENGTRTYEAAGVKVAITFEKEKIRTELLDEDE